MNGTLPLGPERLRQAALEVTGMSCAACAARIEKALGRVDGIQEATVNLALERLSVTLDGSRTDVRHVIEKIHSLGYGARELRKEQDTLELERERERRRLRSRFLWSALFALPLMWTMVGHWSFTSGIWMPPVLMNPWFQLALAAPVQFWLGWPFYAGAYRALRSGAANMDVLIAFSTSISFFYSCYLTVTNAAAGNVTGLGAAYLADHVHHGQGGHLTLYYEASAMIITVVHLGKWLEALAKQRTHAALRKLRELQAKTVTLLQGTTQIEVAVEQIKPGDRVLIRPGERVPVDGTIAAGQSAVDESAVTGEAAPVDKGIGDRLLAGTLNRTGALQLRVTADGTRSAVARMVRLLEDAQSSKPAIQRSADRIAAVFVPILLGLSAVTFLFWVYGPAPTDMTTALMRAVAVLVVACPCAIGLAAPTSVLVGTGKAAQKGVLFKEGRHLEQMHRIDTVLLDKTGTLTSGRLELVELRPAAGNERDLLVLAAAAEWHSEHPLARAVVAAASNRRLAVAAAEQFEALPGSGVRAFVEGREVLVGTRQLLRRNRVEVSEQPEWISRREAQRMTVLFVSCEGKYAGCLVLRDTLPPSSRESIRKLQRLGLEVAMVTGDNAGSAGSVARELGIRRVYADVLPEGKLELVRRLQRDGRCVAMVGDGLNDAAALGAADVGIAVGSGTELAMEAADVTLLGRSLSGVAEAVRAGRSTIANIRQNLAFSLVYNVLAIPFAMFGLLEPWMAGTAMALSSLSVVGNSLRLQRGG